MNYKNEVESIGNIEMLIDYKDGRQERQAFHNTVLQTGRKALARTLANQLGDDFKFYINRMVFGDGGTTPDTHVKRYVNSDRNGLFGLQRLSKPILANLDASVSTQVIFTSVITYDEAPGVVFNEMALVMASGDFYSMTTFPDLTKNSSMQITLNWRINFV